MTAGPGSGPSGRRLADMYTDLPEAELRAYRSGQTDPGDFDAFWADTLAAAQ